MKAAEWNLNSVQDATLTEQSGDQEEDGKTISTNSPNSKRSRPKTLLKVTTYTTNHGSKQQKAVQDGPFLKTNTQ